MLFDSGSKAEETPSMSTRSSKEEAPSFKVGDWVDVGELVPMLEVIADRNFHEIFLDTGIKAL